MDIQNLKRLTIDIRQITVHVKIRPSVSLMFAGVLMVIECHMTVRQHGESFEVGGIPFAADE